MTDEQERPSVEGCVFPRGPEGDRIFEQYLITLGIPTLARSAICDLREASPARKTGRNALHSLTTRLCSAKNDDVRLVESESCEHLFALELELDPEVLGYCCQTPCRGVDRLSASGRRISSPITLDFLVFKRSGVELVECKHLARLQREASKHPHEWREVDGVFKRESLEIWAQQRSIRYWNWMPPEPFGIYFRNLELLYAFSRKKHSGALDPAIIIRLKTLLNRGPLSVAEIPSVLPNVSMPDVYTALAKRHLHGPLKSASLEDPENFMLFTDELRASSHDNECFARIQENLTPVSPTKRSILASAVDYNRGKVRLERIRRMLSGEEPRTKRLKPLCDAVSNATLSGKDPLDLCVTRFADCGNRSDRFSPLVERIIWHVINKYWRSGKTTVKKQIQVRVARIARRLKEARPSYKAVAIRINTLRPEEVDLRSGGKRRYHARKAPTDPRSRTLKPVAPQLCYCIDSSKFDNRTAASIAGKLLFAPPTLYVACDLHEERPVGHALIFGSARTDGLAILTRDYTKRFGVKPHRILVDRGSENRSKWHCGFCADNGISLTLNSTANPRSNSLAENTIKRVNSQLAHSLVGSTLPDQAGRRVDSKFKSYATARMQFQQIVLEVEKYLYGDIAETPTNDGGTPNERHEIAMWKYGSIGIKADFDDDLLVATSVPVAKFTFEYNKGIRLIEGTYSSTELITAGHREYPQEARLDCVDPSKIYVKFPSGWVTAFHQRAQVFASQSPIDRLFHLLFSASLRSDARRTSFDVSMNRQSRLDLATAASPATKHLNESSPKGSAITGRADFPCPAEGDIANFPLEGGE